ncbi:MAG: hypothetical protein KA413_00295 [Candidatus Methylopumilus sp.]|nr:hypothetical protein [Candidatus Methylopumilus sp.]
MAAPSVTYTFSNSTTADATQVNTNFTDLVNSLSDGLKDLTVSSLGTATITVSGAATFNGTVALGNATTDDVTITGYVASDILPKTTGTASLGSATQAWEDIYLDEGATNGGSVYFNAGTTSYLQSSADGATLTVGGFTTVSTPAVSSAGSFTGTNLLLSGSTPIIRATTSDGADNATVQLWGGGSGDVARGSGVNIFGNESAGTGKFRIYGGNVSGGDIEIYTGNATLACKIDYTAQSVIPQKLLDLSTSTAGQIKFPSSQNASADANTLDDYEEGTFTPTDQSGAGLSFAGGTGGFYVKVGRLVHVWAQIIFPATASGSGVSISLPFTSANVSNSYYSGPTYTNQGTEFVSYLPPNFSYFLLRDNTDTGKTNANLSSKFIVINFSYAV